MSTRTRLSSFLTVLSALLSTPRTAAPGRADVRMLHGRAWEEHRLINEF